MASAECLKGMTKALFSPNKENNVSTKTLQGYCISMGGEGGKQ